MLVIVAAAVVVMLGAAAAVALWLLPPRLAEQPRERFTATTTVVVTDGTTGASASLEFDAGWLAIGVGPFLPHDRATVVSPDGAYRAELSLAPAGAFDAATTLQALGLGDEDEQARWETAGWSTETLPDGVLVHHAELTRGTETLVVAWATPAAADPAEGTTGSAPALLLTARVPTDVADDYRTVTAALLATVQSSPAAAPGDAS
ncbi:hypothetical protein GCM10009851_04330 [Herbiconiux moechotypicola]|uniref:Secreted protein n=1 Tax=Herbiconiux moechotypicola TaxID=637393 RepID=A0ABP5Q2P6_9MICO